MREVLLFLAFFTLPCASRRGGEKKETTLRKTGNAWHLERGQFSLSCFAAVVLEEEADGRAITRRLVRG